MAARVRAVSTLFALLVAGGCNAIFGVEEPVLVDSNDGGAGGGGDRVSHGGWSASAGDAGNAGQGLGDGGAIGGTGSGDAGAAGDGTSAKGGRSAAGGTAGSATAGSSAEDGGEHAAIGGATGSGGDASTGGSGGTGGTLSATGGGGGTPVCEKGVRECEDADFERSCDATGQWQRTRCQIRCVADRCAECELREVRCNPSLNSFQECSEDTGLWSEPEDCVNQTCFADRGCEGECAPGQVRCNAETGDAESCDDGAWTVEAEGNCLAQTEICDIESGQALCVPNSWRPLGPNQKFGNGAPELVTPHILRIFRLPPVDQEVQVMKLGLIAEGNTTSFARMAVYEDDGNDYPGTLRATTTSLTITSEASEEIDPSGPLVYLKANTQYWLGVVFRENGSPEIWGRSGTDNNAYQIAHPFQDDFSSTFPAGATEVRETQWNLFLMVRTRTPD
jgi:hypothetical protein